MKPFHVHKSTFDIICIGESLRDVFYKLDAKSASLSIQKERCLLCLEYAEKIPVEHIVKVPAAGNSSNAAVGAKRLGLSSALVTWVGADAAGDDVRKTLADEGVDSRFVLVDKTAPTSEATILNFNGERTQLVYFQPRMYRLPKLPRTSCIYYSAVGAQHETIDKMLLAELDRHVQTYFVFQPGTTHIRQGLEHMKRLIALSTVFILNKDEAHHLFADGGRTMRNMLEAFHRMGARMVVITDGKNGADAFDGTDHWHMPVFKTKAIETTGAGDSFATALTVALLKNHDLPTMLRWGAANSSGVIQEIGPQKGLLTQSGMTRVLKKFAKVKAVKLS